MSLEVYPENYLKLNTSNVKQLSLVLEIDGAPDYLSIVPLYRKIRYGDPGIVYGMPGLVYGALKLIDNFKAYLMVDGNLTIGQRIEPEQGRGSISTLSLNFIDKDGYMSALVSPGVVVDELLGHRFCKVYLGFQNSSFRDDYFVVFRGYVSLSRVGNGKCVLQLSDANTKNSREIFFTGPSELAAPINSVVTSVPLVNASGFTTPILGPAATYDPAITLYLLVDAEYMSYGAGGIVGNTVTVVRGARSSTAALHDSAAPVTNALQIQDHAIDMALKLMLSGWNGPWISDVGCSALGVSLNAGIANDLRQIVLSGGVDAIQDLGLLVGDWVTVSGSGSGNNGTYQITRFIDTDGHVQADNTNLVGVRSKIIEVSHNFTIENPGPGVLKLAFRSQYDTYPINCGMKLTPREVDIGTFLTIKSLYVSTVQYTLRFLIAGVENCKNFIESELFLPLGLYGLTRYGKISLGITKPPLASAKLPVLDVTTILDPDKIQVERAINTRRFFNNVQFAFDVADDGSTFQSITALIDSTSETKIAVNSVLPIQSRGLRTSLGAPLVVQSRGRFLLNRYKQCAFEIQVSVNWSVGSIIEVGDVVLVNDNGQLKITNFDTGEQSLESALFEVIQRQVSVKDGNVKLTLLSSLGFNTFDRYATFSPSSLIVAGGTTTSFRIQDSYGAVYPGDEGAKWRKFVGLPILVHDYAWTRQAEVTLTGFDPGDPYRLLVSPALPFTPQAGDIVDVGSYPSSTDKTENQLYKLLYAFFDPTLTVTAGTSSTVFSVSAPDAAKLVVGLPILIHNASYSIESPESIVLSVVGTTVTVKTSLGFTPAAGQKVECVGFLDGGGAYRWL